jgi:hypothetical protein
MAKERIGKGNRWAFCILWVLGDELLDLHFWYLAWSWHSDWLDCVSLIVLFWAL